MAICPNCLNEMPEGQTLCDACAAGTTPEPVVEEKAPAVEMITPPVEMITPPVEMITPPAAPQFHPAFMEPQPVMQQPMPTFHVPLTKEQLPAQFKPLGAWAYFGYTLLFSLPLIGWIMLLVFSLGGTRNINLRNYARSYFCALLVVVILAALMIGLALVLGVGAGALASQGF